MFSNAVFGLLTGIFIAGLFVIAGVFLILAAIHDNDYPIVPKILIKRMWILGSILLFIGLIMFILLFVTYGLGIKF